MKSILLAAAGLAISTTALLAQPSQPAKASTPQASKPGAAKLDSLPDLTKDPTLFAVGYAHLDTQWRWTYQDSIRDFIPHTLHDNFALFEKYPHYIFNFSGSRRYKMMQEYYPDDYAKLKDYVKAGRWFPCGSSVDENDANVPSAESLVRHVLYGNRFFQKEFGVTSQEYMLPDCFGFPAALPSVLAHCGVKGFSTQKLTWNAVTPIPFKVGVWQGPDGRSVLAALDPGAYVGEVKENLTNDNTWVTRIQNNGKQSGVFTDYHYFGTGDTGGAPREATVAKVEESVNSKGQIKVICAPADAMFKAITPDMAKKLPTYKGELELIEHSAGSISSEAYMKRWNRKNELLADAAERASVAAWWMGGRNYPAQRLEDAWYLLLGSQMHDILPGTSVPKAYDFSWNDECLAANQFAGVLADAAESVISGMDTRSPTGVTSIVVYNPLSYDREDIVEADVPGGGEGTKGVTVTGPDGKPVPAQVLAVLERGWNYYASADAPKSGVTRIAFLAKAPPVGFAAYTVSLSRNAAPNGTLRVNDHELENDFYTVKLDAKGDVSSIFDKHAKKELLSAPARLALCYENPRQWPAWNQDWADRQLPPKSFAGDSGEVTFKVVESGPARVAVEVTRHADGSTFTQRIRLAAGDSGQRVEFDNDIDWRTRERSVRASFPLTVSNPEATYDIQTGALARPNSSAKQFEYPFHQWFDLSTPDTSKQSQHYGVTVMCDSKYAADKPSDNTVRLTLLHTPGTRGGYPDQGSQDLGRHHVLYALTGHADDWRAAHTYAQAQRLNQPLRAFHANPHDGPLGKTFSLISSSSPAVTISAIKKAEDSDEIIVRLREQTGSQAKGVKISLGKPITSAREVDGQERELAKATLTNGALVADINGYELRAFALKLGEAPAKLAKVESEPVTLAYDTDAVTSRANRADGAFDDQGNSLPADQLPAALTDGPITYTLGKTGDGQKNAVNSQGQEIQLPSGSWDRLYVLAAATNEVPTTLEIDGKPFPFNAQSWTGYIGQWDHRLWPGDTSDPKYSWNRDIIGLEPGYIRPAPVAWFSSHYHTKTADSIYQYCYLFTHAFDLPQGAHKIRLPNDSRIKIFAATVAKTGAAHAAPAAPLFDTLDDRAQDAPTFSVAPSGGGGKYDNSVAVAINPGLYWKKGAIHFAQGEGEVTAISSPYEGPIWIMEPTTLKAAVLDEAGHMGPVATIRLEVNDTTPPALEPTVGAAFQSKKLEVTFTELIEPTSAYPSNFKLDPPIDIASVSPSHDGYHMTINLAKPPEVDKTYKLTVSGIKDYSPAKNAMKQPQTLEFTVRGPVYSLDSPKPDQINKPIQVAGLPTKAKDPFTINVFIKTDKQPEARTVIAGFGKCTQDQANGGQGRYISRFSGGLHFWSHNQDAPSRTALDLDKWQMLTATYDGQTLRLFKNAEKVGERAVALSDDESVVNIAPIDPWEHERQFKGEIKNFTIWPSALTDQAITGLMANTPK